jgi:SAM-dependent methyltransferase
MHAPGPAAAAGGDTIAAHGGGAPSAWVRRFAALVRPGGSVLDVACGSGRHVRWLAAQGLRVTGVDRDAAALEALRDVAAVEIVVADIEAGPWPFAGRRFDAVVVTNYLWRPLVPRLRDALAEGGLYLHETFAIGHERHGRPRNPDFLLQPGELLQHAAGLTVVAYEHGVEADGPRCVQRIAAVAPAPGNPAPPLPGPAAPGG